MASTATLALASAESTTITLDILDSVVTFSLCQGCDEYRPDTTPVFTFDEHDMCQYAEKCPYCLEAPNE